MSEPKEPSENEYRLIKLLGDAVTELFSVLSSLNMDPEQIREYEQNGCNYLSETDRYAKHAYEHARAALHQINQARIVADKMRYNLMELKLNLRYDDYDPLG